MRELTTYDVVMKATELKTKQEKIEWLQKNDSKVLRNILIAMYDKDRIEFLLPKTEPEYEPMDAVDNERYLLREARKKLKYFVKGFGYDDMQQYKRETVFIKMLESIHPKDAKLMLMMIKQKPLKGLTTKTINDAFGPIITSKE